MPLAMSPDQLLAFSAFAATAAITPGPNNAMIMASGLNHGLARSLPHLLGICIGFPLMVLATGLGLHAVFVQFPLLQAVLKYGGAVYLLWLAWKLWHAAPMAAGASAATAGKPMGFVAAAAFQWVNPKAWVMAVSAVTTYLPHGFGAVDVAALALVFGLIGTPCVAVWAVFGVAMRRLLQRPRSVRVFNGAMALLLVASLVPLLRD